MTELERLLSQDDCCLVSVASIKKALEQESCEDAISRQAVLDKIKEVCFSTEKEWVDFRVSYGSNGQRDFIVNFIESLPSIQPKPKTGHWVEGQTDNPNIHNILCSCCFEGYPSKGHANSQYTKEKFQWCPKCGAKMDGVETEVEDERQNVSDSNPQRT
jgi:hypothetical protein